MDKKGVSEINGNLSTQHGQLRKTTETVEKKHEILLSLFWTISL